MAKQPTKPDPDAGDPVTPYPIGDDPLGTDAEVPLTDHTNNLSVSDMQADAQGVPRPARQSWPTSGGVRGPAAAQRPAKVYPRMKVRAIADGYYDDVLRRIGDVFTINGDPLEVVIEREVDNMPPLAVHAIPDRSTLTKRQQMQVDAKDKRTSGIDQAGVQRPAAFSSKWMEPVDDRTQEKTTSHNEVLRQQHDDLIAERAGRTAGRATVSDNPNPLDA